MRWDMKKRKALWILVALELCLIIAIWATSPIFRPRLSEMTEMQALIWAEEQGIEPYEGYPSILAKKILRTIENVERWPEYPHGLDAASEAESEYIAKIRKAVLKHYGLRDTWKHAQYIGDRGKYPPTE